ncbi:hypothetical protein MHYP_G00192430 [Metynnis hypsauchen]
MDSTKKVTKKLAGAAARTAAWATNVGNEHGQVAETIKQRRERSAKADDCLVGFGAHKTCTYKELYESADREKKSYVQCLRGQSCKLGSKMDTLKKYIQKRDVDKAMPGCSLPRPGPSRVQSPKAEPTDDELMACALEVDIPAPPPAPVTPPAPLTRSRPPRKAAQKKNSRARSRTAIAPVSASGLYKTVRRVLDIDGWYFMATEYLECHRCRKKVAGWSLDILEQLDPAHRAMFPAILTYR